MEAFSVFAAFSLQDMMTGPLERIRSSMLGVDRTANSLSARFGRLAVAMAPVALAAGVLLGALGAATSQAIAFESAMADVGKVVAFESTADFQAMGDAIRDMAGEIPMAAEGIAAIVASAGQSGVAKQDLLEFAEQAAKMGVAFDLTGDQAGKMMADWRAGMALTLPQVYALADAVNHLSNNMNATAPALGEVIQRVGAAAMSCGLAETQVAALGAAFLSAGASPEIAATALKSFTTTLVKGAAMSETQAAAFRSLGLSASQMAKDMQTDAQGTIMRVMQALAKQPKELQMGLLTQMFGQESIGAIAPLLQNMGNLEQAFTLVGDASQYAGSMQAEFDTRSATTANALQLLNNKLTNLAISIGNAFLPAVGWIATKLGQLVDVIRAVTETKLGQWILKIVGALSTALIAVTALSTSMWFFSSVGPLVARALLPLKTALMGLSAPVLAVIAGLGLLYAAYQANLGGIADYIDGIGRKISLTVRGVLAVFESLKDGTGEIRGELATEIKAAGLEGLVTQVARAVYRIKEFFSGIWDALDFSAGMAVLSTALSKIGEQFRRVGQLIGELFGFEITSAASEARGLGNVLGEIVSWAMEAMATAISTVITGVDSFISVIRLCGAVLTGDWSQATEMARRIWDNFTAVLMNFADLFRIGDWIRNAWAAAVSIFNEMVTTVQNTWNSIVAGVANFGNNLLAGVKAAWQSVLDFFGSLNLFESGAKLLQTFIDGIKSQVSALVDEVSSALGKVREYLPFSDAHTGPLSQLTLSGQRMMTTLGTGVNSGGAGLISNVASVLSSVGGAISSWWTGVTASNEIQAPALPENSVPSVPSAPFTSPQEQVPLSSPAERGAGNQTYHIVINGLSLPNVQDGQSFVDNLKSALQAEIGELEGMA